MKANLATREVKLDLVEEERELARIKEAMEQEKNSLEV